MPNNLCANDIEWRDSIWARWIGYAQTYFLEASDTKYYWLLTTHRLAAIMEEENSTTVLGCTIIGRIGNWLVRHLPKRIECGKERFRLRNSLTGLKLFPATAPLEDIAMDFLGPFRETPCGNIHLSVILDRHSKVVHTVSIGRIHDFEIGKAFTTQWVFTYGAANTILTDNRNQFTFRLMLETQRIRGTKKLLTTT